jgi:hypothetical protein
MEVPKKIEDKITIGSRKSTTLGHVHKSVIYNIQIRGPCQVLLTDE